MIARGLKIAHRLSLLAGIACLLLLAAVNGEILDLVALREVTHHTQFALLGAGVLLAGWGLSDGRGRGRFPVRGWPLVAVILLAFGLRVWNLEDAVHFYVDEGNFVEGILQLWDRPYTKLLSPFNYIAAFTWVYPYLQTGSVAIFGPNLLALRIVSVVFGTLTIPAVYALGRALFNARVALLAALLLAVFPPHIHFSRLGLNNIADPLFGTLALALLVRGLRGGHRADYALAGVMLGLTQYFYEGGRLLYPALVLVWGLMAWRVWRARFAGVLVSALVAALVAFPVYFTLAAWDMSFTARLSNRGLNLGYWGGLLLSTAEDGHLLGHLREQILPPFLHFVTLPDQGQFYYGGRTALILPHLLPVFVIGIVAGLRRHGVALLLPLLWVVFTALGNSLIMQNVWSARYVVAFPAVALLLALGLDVVLRWVYPLSQPGADSSPVNRGAITHDLRMKSSLPAGGQGWGGVNNETHSQQYGSSIRKYAAPALLAVICLSQIIYYFGPHLSLYQSQIRPQHDQQDIVFRVRDLPPGTKTYLISDDTDIYLPVLVFLSRFWGMEDIELLMRHPTRLEDWEALDSVWWGVNHAFFVEQRDRVTQDYLRQRFGFDDPGSLSPYPVPAEKQFLMLYYQPTPPVGE